MKKVISVHSVIDVITNSSTEMFMDFSKSLEHLKELIDEVLKINGTDKKCDDIFELSIRPSWWNDKSYMEASEQEFDLNNWTDSGEDKTILHIETKDPEFDSFRELVEKFMNSIELNEYMC